MKLHASPISCAALASFMMMGLLFSCAGTHSHAAVIYSHTGPSSGTIGLTTTSYVANNFLVGGSDMTLTSVNVFMENANNSSGNFFVRLYSNNGSNRPGTLLETLSGSSSPATTGTYTYTGSTLLSANTSYWIVEGVSSGSGFYKWAHDSINDPVVGSSLGLVTSSNQASSWGSILVFSSHMVVNGSAVPEPSRVLLLALSAITVLTRRRR